MPPRLKGWIPPSAIAMLGRIRHGRSGLGEQMASWEAAREQSDSYDEAVILRRVREAVDQARSGARDGMFERDGVVLRDEEPPLKLVACLLHLVSGKKDDLTVIDFGGSLGSTYRQCVGFLSGIGRLRWHVVEQPAYVDCGKSGYETDDLRFYKTIEEAAAVSPPDAVLFSGVLQYLDDPYDILARAIKLGPRAIIVDRNPESSLADDSYTIQYVPKNIYPVRLPFRIFGANRFTDRLKSQYRKITEFAALDPNMMAGSLPVRFRGYLFERTT